jgi:hypothetical protein
MNTKGTKFLAVLAVMVMAFAAIAIVAPADMEITGTTTSTSAPEKAVEVSGYTGTAWTELTNVLGQSGEGYINVLEATEETTVTIFKNVTTATGEATYIDVTENDNVTFLFKNRGLSLTIPEGASFTGIVAYGDTTVKIEGLVAGEGGVTITSGSIEIAGAIDDDLTLTPEDGSTVVLKDVDATGKTITVADEQTIYVMGVVKGTISIPEDANVVVKDGGDISEAHFTGEGASNVELDADDTKRAEKDISGDIARTASGEPLIYSASQLVVVAADCTLLTGAEVEIRGALVIPEGKKLTIEAGAKLTISNNATFDIEGVLEIEEAQDNVAAGELVVKTGNVNVTGGLDDDGLITISDFTEQFPANVNILPGAVAVIDDEGAFVVHAGLLDLGQGHFNVGAGALLTVTGKMGRAITNAGTVYINSTACADNSTRIFLVAEGASVNVVNYTVDANTNYTLGITDAKLVFISYWDRAQSKDIDVELVGAHDSIVITPQIIAEAAPAAGQYSVTFGGLKVVATTSASSTNEGNSEANAHRGIYNGKQYSKALEISGSFFADCTYIGNTTSTDDYTGKATVTTSVDGTAALKKKCSVKVVDDIVINDNITLANGATMDVTGSIVTSFNNSYISNTGKITVTKAGYIQSISRAINSEDGVSAAKFITTVPSITGATVKVYNYYSLDGALEIAGIISPKEIIVLGTTQKVTKNATLPAPVALVLENDSKFTVKEGVLLYIEDGAAVKGAGRIDVDGTMYAENKSNVKSGVTVVSDVKTEELDEKGRSVKDGWVMWTNLAAAVAVAEPGDEITVTKTEDPVILSKNLVIPAEVTVVVPNGTVGLLLLNGVTLTVDGVLLVESNIFAEQAFGLTAQKVANTGTDARYSSAIIVNGALLTTGEIKYGSGAASADDTSSTYDNKVALLGGQYAAESLITFTSADPEELAAARDVTAPIAGAYYSIRDDGKSYNVISSLNVAMAGIDSIMSNITINGEVGALFVSFESTKYLDTIIIDDGTDGTAPYTAPTSSETGNLVPTSLTVGIMEIEEAKLVSEITTINNSTYGGAFSGLISNADKNAVSFVNVLGQTVEDKSGKLYLSGANVTQGTGLTDGIVIQSGIVHLGDNVPLTFVGMMTVANDAIASVNSANLLRVDVYGGFTVAADKSAVVDFMNVYGTVAVAEGSSTSTKGDLTINGYLCIGISGYDVAKGREGTTGNFYGPFTPGALAQSMFNALVSADAVVDDAAKAVLSSLKSTMFVVNDKEWFTVYAKAANEEMSLPTLIPVENAKCPGWMDVYGNVVGDEENEVVIGYYDVLYAIVDYNIYVIQMYTDAGVKSVAIDGIEMFNNQNNLFTTVNPIKAGVHTVTFTLKDGYEGTPVLYTMNGTILKDYKFTVNGTPEGNYNITFQYQLYGTEKEVPEPTPEPPTPEEVSEWTITTILLVILVILIAIMAVIVALRLNRS